MLCVRYIGLDVGDRWIGLAMGDDQSHLATPIRTLRRSSRSTAPDVDEIARLYAREGAGAAIVGLPRNMDGSLGIQARRTLAFAARLRAAGLVVDYCDERLSSAAAEDYVTGTRGRPLKRGERIDHVAAAIILQDYLDGARCEIEDAETPIDPTISPAKPGAVASLLEGA